MGFQSIITKWPWTSCLWKIEISKGVKCGDETISEHSSILIPWEGTSNHRVPSSQGEDLLGSSGRRERLSPVTLQDTRLCVWDSPAAILGREAGRNELYWLAGMEQGSQGGREGSLCPINSSFQNKWTSSKIGKEAFSTNFCLCLFSKQKAKDVSEHLCQSSVHRQTLGGGREHYPL